MVEEPPRPTAGATPLDARDDVRRHRRGRAASCPRSPPTSRRRPAAGRSTCSTSRRAPSAGDPDVARLRDRPRRPQARARRAPARRRRQADAEARRARARAARAGGGGARRRSTAIERAGGTAHWHAVDLTDAGRGQTRAGGTSSAADVLIHAAGLDISHPLPDKPQAEYDLVFDVKADGWFNVLHALRGKPLGAAVAFSSIAGRFGNAGADRLRRRQRPAVQGGLQPAPQRRHARHRDRLDRVGRDRHGDRAARSRR